MVSNFLVPYQLTWSRYATALRPLTLLATRTERSVGFYSAVYELSACSHRLGMQLTCITILKTNSVMNM